MPKDLVLIGGGHSHVEVLKRFGEEPLSEVRLTLICRDVNTPYSGMLPGLIAGHYTFDEAHIDLGPLTRFAGAQFYHDWAVGLDVDNRWVLCGNHPPIPYDVVSIDIGSAPRTADMPGAVENAIPVKPIDQFVARWEKLCERVLSRRDPVRIGVVGGGAGAVEILLAIQYRLRRLLKEQRRSADHLTFYLLTDSSDILPTHNRRVRVKFRRVLAERSIQVYTEHRVVGVEPGVVHCENGMAIRMDEILWVIQAGAADWVAKTGLAVDEQGFIRVNDCLQSISHPTVFAAGDIAAMVNHPRPKAGVFAVRQGPPLKENLSRFLRDEPLKPFVPQKEFLAIITTGNQYAIASRSGWALEGHLIWRWKNWIDRRFIRNYGDLPEGGRTASG